jgi:hypothetical protein
MNAGNNSVRSYIGGGVGSDSFSENVILANRDSVTRGRGSDKRYSLKMAIINNRNMSE